MVCSKKVLSRDRQHSARAQMLYTISSIIDDHTPHTRARQTRPHHDHCLDTLFPPSRVEGNTGVILCPSVLPHHRILCPCTTEPRLCHMSVVCIFLMLQLSIHYANSIFFESKGCQIHLSVSTCNFFSCRICAWLPCFCFDLAHFIPSSRKNMFKELLHKDATLLSSCECT